MAQDKKPELQAVNWRLVWNVLHAYGYGKLGFLGAQARLINAGLPPEAAHYRLSRTQLSVFDPIPDGDYTAMISKVERRAVNTKAGPGVVIDITYALQAPDVAARLGRELLTVRQGIFADLTPAGDFDMAKGKNVQLNRVRAAVGQNEAGKPWNLEMLQGAGPLKVHVKLRPDKNASDVIYTDVSLA